MQTHENSGLVRHWALIPCAGSGTRALTQGPKQYQNLLGWPLVQHTLQAFLQVPQLSGVLVVLAPQDTEFAAHGLDRLPRLSTAPCGGSTRAQSVHNGLLWLLDHGATRNDWVLVHDAARCLVTSDQIQQLMAACGSDAVGGLLAHQVPDTLKQAQEGSVARVAATVPRSGKWLAQTPQMFRLGPLLDALGMAGLNVTDESSAMEAMGLSPLLVEGGAQNFKVTYPADFALAEAVLAQRKPHPTGAPSP